MNLPVWLQLRTQFFDSITLLTADKLKKKKKQTIGGGRKAHQIFKGLDFSSP